jgi:heme-degrading monooxygenase HmoA
MATVVLIQRDVIAKDTEEVIDLLRQLRAKALNQPGYLTGETLFSPDKAGSHLVVSRWRSLSDWREWEANEERKVLETKMAALLVSPAVVSVYVDAPSMLPEDT